MNSNIFLHLFILLALTLSSSALAGEFRKAVDIREWTFPCDHGAHKDFQTEWWYFTGHLESVENITYGFELTFFRFANSFPFKIDSAWEPSQVYLTHFAVTDESRDRFLMYELVNRDAFEIAGASEDTLDVWNGSYRAQLVNGEIVILASNRETRLDLNLKISSDVVLNGENGLSRKGPGAGEASYYYSIHRLTGNGTLKIDGVEVEIESASVWMDREFFTIPETQNEGWGWFAIQFDDGSSLMIYNLRDEEGSKTEYSSGTYVSIDRHVRILNAEDFEIVPLDHWKSDRTGITYPVKWRLSIPSLDKELLATATMNDQELALTKFIDLNYWEGRSLVEGTHSGQAYIELVGY